MGKVVYAAIFTTLLVAGCAIPVKPADSIASGVLTWHGRLTVRVESDQTQSFTAGFELSGSPLVGELTLYTPFGNTAASLSWSPQTAVMRTPKEVRYFESLDTLIEQAVGTDIPVTALFAWMSGDNMVAAGWRADLSQHANGRITARRAEPLPVAELRIALEP